MQRFKDALVKVGISMDILNKMTDKELRRTTQNLNLIVPRGSPRIETGKNGAQYAVTDSFSVPKYNGKQPVAGETSLAKNLYVRVEAIDQIIADLQAAKALLK